MMEILTLMLHRRVMESGLFTYHKYCSKLELINLCFADDLFLFAYGYIQSATLIMEALEEFKFASRLTPSLPKSTSYFCNVLNHIKISILHILPFDVPLVKYLGVPLVSSRLMVRDCKELIEKVQIRVQDWKNKSLSIAGRLQLIISVIGSMHIYWASVFMLPSRDLLDIEQVMRGFLWCQGEMKKGKAKVAWEVVCLPKDEGGLGIRLLEHFNSALMVSHVWKLLSLKESLWVKWIHVYKLNGRSFWDVPIHGNLSWGWRKFFQLRPVIREFIWYKLGDGAITSLWYDRWCENCPLSNQITTRDMFRTRLNLSSKVKDIVQDGAWVWPPDLLAKYPFISSCSVPVVEGSLDKLKW
ncbi:hypothetical protein Tco_0489948 [Tanacetum coccineum]